MTFIVWFDSFVLMIGVQMLVEPVMGDLDLWQTIGLGLVGLVLASWARGWRPEE